MSDAQLAYLGLEAALRPVAAVGRLDAGLVEPRNQARQVVHAVGEGGLERVAEAVLVFGRLAAPGLKRIVVQFHPAHFSSPVDLRASCHSRFRRSRTGWKS